MEQELIKPLYFLHSDVKQNKELRDYDVCMAVTRVINKKHLKGVQKIGNLWRVFMNAPDARAQLSVKGLDIAGQHITLITENPYAFSAENNNRPIKVTLYDVKMHYANEVIEQHLKGIGIKLVKPVEHGKVKDNDGNETEFYNGERVTYVCRSCTSQNSPNTSMDSYWELCGKSETLWSEAQIRELF